MSADSTGGALAVDDSFSHRTWRSPAGLELTDFVPSELRDRWVARDWCPGRDLFSLFNQHAQRAPQRQAVIDGRGSLDYAALAVRTRVIAAGLERAGFGPGDVIGLCLPNDRRAVAAELAIAALGAVTLSFPVGCTQRDALQLLGDSRARAIITIAAIEHSTGFVALISALPHLQTVFVFGHPPSGCQRLDASGIAAGGSDWTGPSVDPESPARFLVSSGSLGRPKLVAYSHNAFAGGRARYVAALQPTDVMRNLVLVPLASSFGSCGIPVTIASLGGTLILCPTFAPALALEVISRQRPTLLFAVPTMLGRMAAAPRSCGENLSSLAGVVSSGAPLPAATAAACAARFPAPVIDVYGSTDGVNCHPGPTAAPLPLGCVGRPDPRVVRIRVAGSDGQAMPAGVQGEIWARGPMTPLCCVAAPELNQRQRRPGGWVRTGDRGFIDAVGRLTVVGRIDATIIRGGYNINPAEVELDLSGHPAIADVACIAIPDADLGQRLCACVAQRPGTRPLSLDDVQRFLEHECGLERRKLPESLLHVPQLPLGPAGKVNRQALVRLAAAAVRR